MYNVLDVPHQCKHGCSTHECVLIKPGLMQDPAVGQAAAHDAGEALADAVRKAVPLRLPSLVRGWEIIGWHEDGFLDSLEQLLGPEKEVALMQSETDVFNGHISNLRQTTQRCETLIMQNPAQNPDSCMQHCSLSTE